MVVNLSATTEHEAALIGAGALAPLVGLLSADSPGTQKQAARALANLSVNEEHKHTIIELGALEALRDMHASPVEETKEASHYLCHRHLCRASRLVETLVLQASSRALSSLNQVLTPTSRRVMGARAEHQRPNGSSVSYHRPRSRLSRRSPAPDADAEDSFSSAGRSDT